MGNPILPDNTIIQQVILNTIKHLPSASQVAHELTTLTGNTLNTYIEDMLIMLNQDNQILLNSLNKSHDITTLDALELHELSTKLKNIISYLQGFRHCLHLRLHMDRDEYI